MRMKSLHHRTGELALPFRYLVWVVLMVSGQASQLSASELKVVQLPSTEQKVKTAASAETFGEILRYLLLESMKEEYEDNRNWRGTVDRFDGFRIRGTRISKREREVPHGIWHRYKVSLIRPEETFDVEINQLDPTESGSIPFEIVINLKARCEATFVWWTYGVKGVNGTSVSNAKIQMKLLLETSPTVRFDLNSPLPGIDFRPKVKDVQIKLKDLDVKQVGVLEGKVVEVLGDGSRKAVENVMQQQEDKIKTKLQKSLDGLGK
ncbi:hypothetical protein SH668x_002492 [Planctomicrobium sp. SH668]|uniref:hypothetical protein n=1 Tax=Planctomicrobium sp. SH668 TaxID=3448126 RepID=UPI003F5CBB4C